MEGQELVPFDWKRMWLGDAPLLFLAEIAFRTVVMYGWLLLLLRIVGRRGLAQLSIVEFAIVIALGSAVGDAPFYPDVPLLHAMLVVTVVVFMQWVLAWLINRSEGVETFMEGRPVCVVERGLVNLEGLRVSSLSTEELFERLRLSGVKQLGEVGFAFIEQGGNLSLFQYDADRKLPGLPIVPPGDLRHPGNDSVDAQAGGLVACVNCGNVRSQREQGECSRCGWDSWVAATLDPLKDEP